MCRLLIFWVSIWFVIPCHEALMSQRIAPIQSEAMPVVLKVATIRTKVVTNEWNTWNLWRVFYKWCLNLIKRYVHCKVEEQRVHNWRIIDVNFSFGGETGHKNSGTFLQKRIPRDIRFPCQRYMQRSVLVPDNVHQLRPGELDTFFKQFDAFHSMLWWLIVYFRWYRCGGCIGRFHDSCNRSKCSQCTGSWNW